MSVWGNTVDPRRLGPGSAAVPSAAFQGSNTGIFLAAANTLGIAGGGAEVARFVGGAAVVNRLSIYGGNIGSPVSLNADGVDAGISLQLVAKGGGQVYAVTGNGAAGGFGSYAPSSVNGMTIFGNATGAPVLAQANGADANIGMALVPKGTGALTSAVPDSAVTGGNARGTNAVDWQTSRALATQVASGTTSVIAGGDSNAANGSLAVILGGTGNVASGSRSAIIGGASNLTDASYGVALGGQYGTTRATVGKVVYASGRFVAAGDAQLGEHVLRRQTTDATVTRLTSDGAAANATNSVPLPNLGTYRMKLLVAARQTGGAAGTVGDSASWEANVLMKRGANAAATVFIGGNAQTSAPALAAVTAGTAFAPNFNDAAAAAWRLTLDADTTNGGLTVNVTGEVNKNINWVARVQSIEVVG